MRCSRSLRSAPIHETRFVGSSARISTKIRKASELGRPDASRGQKPATCSEAELRLSCVVHSAAVSHLDSGAWFAEVRADEAPAHLKAASAAPDAQQAVVSGDAEPVGCVAALQVALILVDCLVPAEADSLARRSAAHSVGALPARRSAWRGLVRADC